jgi:hypothetical protein
MKPTKKAQVLAPLLVCLLVPFAGTTATGCKKDEPPPPLPSAAPPPAATPTQTAPIELVPEEIPAPSASASVTPPKTGSTSSLKKCCAALRQNAASAPEPNKTYMLNAATACDMGASIGALGGLLRGAGLPAACK